MEALILPLVTLALMWGLLIRPQQQRVRRQQAMLARVEVGDDVVTAAGVYGRVVRLDDGDAWLELAPGVTVRMVRAAISRRLAEEVYEEEEEEEDSVVDEDGEP